VLRGRGGERAAIAALVDDARSGRGGALVLRGAPGVGKSALVADAAAGARGVRVLRASGVESESPLAFAALHRLLRPLLGQLDALPVPQARALRVAFGEEEGPDADRFRIFLAALSLLAQAATEVPVFAVVDDAQWLDEASAAALLFVARRVQDEPVALLFAAREGDVGRFDTSDLPELMIGGVDPATAAELLAERVGAPVSAEVGERLVARTGGNPLALVELAAALPAAVLTGAAPLPAQLPVTEGVERVFLERARRLPDSAQTLLLVAAADDSGQVATVRRAAAGLGVDEPALDAVERAGLVQVHDGQLELRHPLVRSAVYGAATSGQRRRAHAALAAALSEEQDADRRAWHRAAAASEPDEAVAEELERAAERARHRGGQEAAAAALERAAELTPQPGDARARRRYRAAVAAWLGGQPVRARALAEAGLLDADDPGLRADIARLRARVEWNTGSILLGHRMLLRAARGVAVHDPQRAREMALIGAAIASVGGSSGAEIAPAALVPPATERDPRSVRCGDALMRGLDALSHNDWAAAAPLLRQAFALAEPPGELDVDVLANLGVAATQLGDDEAVLRFHTVLLTRARDADAMIMVLYALTRRAGGLITTGRWADAVNDAAEALQLAEAIGQPALTGLPLAWLALLAALRGDKAGEAHLAAAERVLAEHPAGTVEPVTRAVVSWVHAQLARAQPASALHHLQQMTLPMVRRMAALDRIECAIRCGDGDGARAELAEVESFITATGAVWAAATAEHARALLADDGEAETHFERALAHHARSPRRVDRARTELAFGEHLRRIRRRVDARGHLRAALQTFDEVGAVPWAERARQELRASGESARRRDDTPTGELTPQELQVARLVAEGLSNRDVAGRLYISPRTVEFHLRNIFTKAGVSSRAELARLPLG
jgi:DNA-binding CsgD family transcriptional regulator